MTWPENMNPNMPAQLWKELGNRLLEALVQGIQDRLV